MQLFTQEPKNLGNLRELYRALRLVKQGEYTRPRVSFLLVCYMPMSLANAFDCCLGSSKCVGYG